MIGTIVFFMALGGIVPAIADRIEHRRTLTIGEAQMAEATDAVAVDEEDATSSQSGSADTSADKTNADADAAAKASRVSPPGEEDATDAQDDVSRKEADNDR